MANEGCDIERDQPCSRLLVEVIKGSPATDRAQHVDLDGATLRTITRKTSTGLLADGEGRGFSKGQGQNRFGVHGAPRPELCALICIQNRAQIDIFGYSAR
jgi:hypothetical protein